MSCKHGWINDYGTCARCEDEQSQIEVANRAHTEEQYRVRIADLERQLAEAKAEIEAMRPLTSLVLFGPDGEKLVISSDIEHQTDGSFRFTVTSPISGRRFGVVCGITELCKWP